MRHIALNIKTLKRFTKATQMGISTGTGISQSRLSRLENGAAPKHDEIVGLANHFGVPLEMLSEEDIAARFETAETFLRWQTHHQAQKQKVLDQAAAISRAPLLLDALLEHYATTMSQVSGKTPIQIWEEVEVLYHKRVAANQGAEVS